MGDAAGGTASIRFNHSALKLFLRSPELVIPYLQNQFYFLKKQELENEKETLNRKLEHYAFDEKMDELTQKSLRLFRAELATRCPWKSERKRFKKSDFRRESAAFTNEYPVVLSTTYSIKGTLGIDHIYDYLIVDEASQVDLATGVPLLRLRTDGSGEKEKIRDKLQNSLHTQEM